MKMKTHLPLLLLLSTVLLFNSCQKEVSFENNANTSVGLLQSDVTGDCLPKTVNGIYEAGTALVGTNNYLEVEVDVSVAGTYTITTDTVNGIHFRGTGTFSTTGLNTVRLAGVGKPTAAGISIYTVKYAGLSECAIAVTTLPAGAAVPATFTLEGSPGTCMSYDLQGDYTVGTAMTVANKVVISVNVTVIGTYNISTTLSNGLTFSGSGVVGTTGPTTITLSATGTPLTAGPTNVAVSTGSSNCSFTVPVQGPGGYTINCGSAAINGTYTQGVALTAANSVDIGVNVTTLGSFTIVGTVNGMTFSKTGTFAATGNQTINLIASGTPTASGPFNVPLTGGTTPCSFAITVASSGPAAVYTVTCASAVANGTYTQGVALGATNTITVSVNVTTIGNYTLTGTVSGMTFVKSGTFPATGAQTLTLTGSGTPTANGALTVPLTGASAPCSVPVTVAPAAGAATYTINCPLSVVNGTYKQGVALGASNTITVTVNVTVAGTYTLTGTVSGMTFTKTGTFPGTGPQTFNLTGSGTPTASGTLSVSLTGAATACSVPITVAAAGGAATFTTDCGSASPNGTYQAGVALTASNTVDIDVNVAVAGTYTITGTVNGMTFTKSGTFPGTGIQTITLVGSGTPATDGVFDVPLVGGTAGCTFSVFVDVPGASGTWSFIENGVTYSGTIDFAEFDNTTFDPALLFFFTGTNASGEDFEIDLLDISATISNNENYNMATFTGTANTGGFYFTGAGTKEYNADPGFTGNTVIAKVTNHNTTTKTMTGTFSGKALDENGVLKTITSGAFTVTYP
jgi:hypothetical protein